MKQEMATVHPKVVVLDVKMDGRWAARAQELLAHGESEGRFWMSGFSLHSRKCALFAFLGEEGDADDAVGIMTYATFDLGDHRKTFRMDLLSVDPIHRRSGVALALVKNAYQIAVRMNCTEIDALVSTFNFPMMRLIHREGFGQQVVHMRRFIEENRPHDDWDF